MEVQEEIISSWQVQDGVLHAAAFHQKRMRSIRARRDNRCPAGALFGRAEPDMHIASLWQQWGISSMFFRDNTPSRYDTMPSV